MLILRKVRIHGAVHHAVVGETNSLESASPARTGRGTAHHVPHRTVGRNSLEVESLIDIGNSRCTAPAVTGAKVRKFAQELMLGGGIFIPR